MALFKIQASAQPRLGVRFQAEDHLAERDCLLPLLQADKILNFRGSVSLSI